MNLLRDEGGGGGLRGWKGYFGNWVFIVGLKGKN